DPRVVNNTSKKYWQYQCRYFLEKVLPIPIPILLPILFAYQSNRVASIPFADTYKYVNTPPRIINFSPFLKINYYACLGTITALLIDCIMQTVTRTDFRNLIRFPVR